MYRFKTIVGCALLAAATGMLQLAAVAQFEISPDHFTERDRSTVARAGLQPDSSAVQIVALQQELEGYYSAIQQQTEAVERAQEMASGAGTMGDSAYVFIDDYVRQKRELELLKKELAPQIVLAQIRQDALKQAQLAASTPAAAAVTRKAVAANGETHQRGVLIASAPKLHK
jgi:hypothetical protein